MQVVLSDGDLSTLSNMRLNLESNLLSTRIDVPECKKDASTVSIGLWFLHMLVFLVLCSGFLKLAELNFKETDFLYKGI